MKEKSYRKAELIIIGIIAVVVVGTILLVVMWVDQRNHHEPYISAESYEELKGLLDDEETICFPDELLEQSSYNWGKAELADNKIKGYYFSVVDIKESSFDYIILSGGYKNHFYEQGSEATFTNIINVDGVEIIEEFYENIDTNDVISYEFVIGDVEYTLCGGLDMNFDDGIPPNIYPDNQELFEIAEMIIEQ